MSNITESGYDKCNNSLCDRFVLINEVYCCHACLVAYVNKYEIHSEGLLGHSQECNVKQREREQSVALDDFSI